MEVYVINYYWPDEPKVNRAFGLLGVFGKKEKAAECLRTWLMEFLEENEKWSEKITEYNLRNIKPSIKELIDMAEGTEEVGIDIEVTTIDEPGHDDPRSTKKHAIDIYAL